MVGRSKFVLKIGLGVLAGCSAGLLALEGSVSAATATLEDFEEDGGNFEYEYPDDWEVYQERVILGETELGGCTSLDTADYSELDNYVEVGNLYTPYDSPSFGVVGDTTNSGNSLFKDWKVEIGDPQYVVGGLPVWVNTYWQEYGFGPDDGSDPIYFGQLSNSQRRAMLTLQAETLRDQPEVDRHEDRFDVMVLDGEGYGIGRDPASQVLQLYSWIDSYAGHVIHGPAVVSKDLLTISGPATATIEFDFAASRDMDNYHVFGYLQSTDCSTQIELFDETGAYSNWQTVTESGIGPGTYQFVFVGGSYDETWGGLGGAKLWIDDIKCTGEGTSTCEVVDTCDDCEQIVGEGLLPNQLVPVPNDVGPAVDFSWSAPELAESATEPETLPNTGTNTNLAGLATALLILGSSTLLIRRRVAVVAARR